MIRPPPYFPPSNDLTTVIDTIAEAAWLPPVEVPGSVHLPPEYIKAHVLPEG